MRVEAIKRQLKLASVVLTAKEVAHLKTIIKTYVQGVEPRIGPTYAFASRLIVELNKVQVDDVEFPVS